MNSDSVQPITAANRTVLYREKAAGFYRVAPYTLG